MLELKMDFYSATSLIFVSGTKSGDCHEAMHRQNFEHWLLLMMDNASYHNVLVKESPTQSWRKDETISWLQEKRFHILEDSCKAELLNLAGAYKSPRKM
jgi:hypothetical protein